jgi:hypothetical protein
VGACGAREWSTWVVMDLLSISFSAKILWRTHLTELTFHLSKISNKKAPTGHDDANLSTIFDTAPKQTKALWVEKRESKSWRMLFHYYPVPRLISIT